MIRFNSTRRSQRFFGDSPAIERRDSDLPDFARPTTRKLPRISYTSFQKTISEALSFCTSVKKIFLRTLVSQTPSRHQRSSANPSPHHRSPPHFEYREST